MSRRQIVFAAVLIVVTAAALVIAHRIARAQERAAIARAAVPPLPDLERWPAALAQELERSTNAVRRAADPVAALAQVAKLHAANRFDSAAPTMDVLHTLEPRNPRWPYLLADIQLRRGDFAAAARLLQICVTLAPQYAPAWLRLGDVQMEMQAFDAAHRSYVRAANLTAGGAQAQFALVRLQAETGSRGDPRPRLTALVRSHPDIREFHALLAQVLSAAGEREAAAAEQRLASRSVRRLDTSDPWRDELDPLCFDPNRLGRLAQQRLEQQRLTEAVALLERAVELAPADTRLRLDLAGAYARSDRATDARVTLERAVAACPNEPELPARLAAALRVEHKSAEAAAVARLGLARWPESPALQAQLGFALRELGENQAAIPVLQAAVRQDPTSAETWYALAYSLLALKQPAAAREAAEAAVALRPEFAEALVMLGGMAVDRGDIASAERIVGQLQGLQPGDPGSRLLFAGLQLMKGSAAEEAGDLDAATQCFRQGLATAPDFAPLLRENGLLAVRRSELSEAVEMFDRYLRLQRRDLRAYLWLGDALVESDRETEARDVFERGLAAAQQAGDRTRITEFSTRLDR